MKPIHIYGGGAVTDFDTLSSQSSVAKPSRFFKPLVASSLALALGVSVASATIDATCGSNGSCTPITADVTFNFSDTEASNGYDSASNTVTIASSVNSVTLNDSYFGGGFNFSGKTLTIGFGGWSNSRATKTFTINSTNAFLGNIKIFGGGTFSGDFKQDFTGNITLTYNSSSNVQERGKTTITFGGDYNGIIDAGFGVNNFTFSKSDAQISGKLIARTLFGDSWGHAVNTFTFSENATISASIEAYSGGYGGKGQNILNFSKTGTISGKIFANGGSNKITFTKDGTISNAIEADDIAVRTTNELIFSANAIFNNSASITAKQNGTNTLTFAGNITGGETLNITAQGGYTAINNLVFNTTSGTISLGKIIADGNHSSKNQNNIETTQAGVNLTLAELIAGPQTKQNNYASMNTNTISTLGTLTITKGGLNTCNGGKNVISANSLILSDDDTTTISISDGWQSQNDITITGNTQSFGKVEIKNSVNGVSNKITLANAGKLTIGDIYSQGNGAFGVKYKEVSKDDGSKENVLTAVTNYIQATNEGGSIEITGDITTGNGGLNIINAKALSMDTSKTIAVNGGWAGYNVIHILGTAGETTTLGKVYAQDKNSTGGGNIINIEAGNLQVQELKVNRSSNSFTNLAGNNITVKQGSLTIASGGVQTKPAGETIINAQNIIFTDNANDIVIDTGWTTKNKITLTGSTATTFGKVSVNSSWVNSSSNTIYASNSAPINLTLLFSNGGKVIANDNNTINQAESGNQNTIALNSGKLTISGNGEDGAKTSIQASNNAQNFVVAKGGASITGDIIASSGGRNNIYIKENSPTAGSLTGNITTNSGANNVVFDMAFWTPASVITKAGTSSQSSGTLTTTGGVTNLVFRQGANNPLGTSSAVFNVIASGGQTNIVMGADAVANDLNAIAKLNYSGNANVNIFFSSTNNYDPTNTNGSGNIYDDFVGNDANSIKENKILGVTYDNGVKLLIQDKKTSFGNESAYIVEKFGSLYRLADGNIAQITSNRTTNSDTAIVSGLLVGELSSLATSTKNYTIELADNSAVVGSISLPSTSQISLKLDNASKIILTSNFSTIKTLTLAGTNAIDIQQFALSSLAQNKNTIIDLATNGGSSSAIANRENFRVLVIGESASADTGLQGNGSLVFVNYVNVNANQSKASIGGTTINGKNTTAYADRIVIKNAGDNSTALSGKYYMQLAVAESNLSSIKYTEGTGTADTTNKNIAVATIVKKTNASGGTTEQEIRNMGVITLQEADTLQGFDVLSGSLKAVETDENGEVGSGKNGYISYFINSIQTTGADSSIQDTTASAFATSLDIFMANFNSLNKRMGELRNNDNSQGAWARVFGGAQSSSFGLGSKTSYVTTQAGYDYAFGFEGANNYLGVALAYSYASSSTSNATNTLNGVSEGIEGDLKSNMVEVALYNSYVQDEGWYNDSIFKFNYIMNSFSTTGTAMGNSVSTDTFGIILSDEFGYRFRLGGNNEWYIDPQAEFSFGYVNGTEYTLTSGYSTLLAKSDAMMQLRARAGSSFGYDFKNFTEGKAIKASVYVGAFYEYDYLNGGDVTLTTNLGGVNSLQSSLASDGRVVMNVGTNMTIKDNTRIYFDFEKSFAGKINTDYQVNVGVRYSFGENTSYTPMGVKKEVAPLKVSDENTQTPQESKESVEENSKQENAEQTQESKENKAQ